MNQKQNVIINGVPHVVVLNTSQKLVSYIDKETKKMKTIPLEEAKKLGIEIILNQ